MGPEQKGGGSGVGAFAGNDEVREDKRVGRTVRGDVQRSKKQFLERQPGNSLQVTAVNRDMTSEG